MATKPREPKYKTTPPGFPFVPPSLRAIVPTLSPVPSPSVITIGNFDGVHVGHAALIRTARELANMHAARVVALAFDPHPMTLLKPEAAPSRLMAFDRRAELLEALGADEVHRLEPTPALLAKTPEDFIRTKVEKYGAIAFVEGYDFHFGKGRAGNNAVLAALGRGLGFETRVVEPVQVTLTDHTIVTASSSLTRWLVSNGRARDASIVLGRPHELVGNVGPGDRRGRTIGFPTANLRTTDMLPADGVYAAWACLEDGRRFPAAVNIGPRPTFAGMERRVEAHLIGAARSGESPAITGLPEYDWSLRLEIVAWVRDQVRFESIERLTDQLKRDVARAASICHNPPPSPLTPTATQKASR